MNFAKLERRVRHLEAAVLRLIIEADEADDEPDFEEDEYSSPAPQRTPATPVAPPEPADQVHIYTFPGAPPTGRKVRTSNGYLFERRASTLENLWGVWECCDITGWDGTGDDIPWGAVRTWPELLFEYDRVTLEPLTDKEKAEEVLYGPLGQRWGNPDEPCPFRECALGVGHIGVHTDAAGQPLGITELDPDAKKILDASIGLEEATETPCLCGRPSQHRPTCPRYQRVAYGELGGNYA